MTNQDLYRAIGEADDAFLLECETQPVRRVSRRFGLIAAVIALMLTACAAPVAVQAFHALKEASVTQTGHKTIEFEVTPDTLEANIYQLQLDVEISPDAPDTVETTYFPTALEKYGRDFRWYGLNDNAYCVYFDMGETTWHGYSFTQRPLSYHLQDGKISLELWSSTVHPLEVSSKTYGDVTALEVISGGLAASSAEGAFSYAERGLYWSDGMYLFSIWLPVDTSDELVTEILNSLALKEDPGENFFLYNHFNYIKLDFTASKDAPDTIEETYLPLRLLEKGQVEFWGLEENCLYVELTMDGPGDSTYIDVRYEQRVIPEETPIRIETLYYSNDSIGEQVTYGAIQATEFHSTPETQGQTSGYGPGRFPTTITAGHHIYWTDGRYIYSVSLPATTSDSSIEKILASLTAVEDITEYLTTAE